MKKSFLILSGAAIIIIIAGSTSLRLSSLDGLRNVAATFFIPSITTEDLREKYLEAERGGEKVKILLVPGHEPGYGGAEYGSLKERDMNVELAETLSGLLSENQRFEVIVARDKEAWNPELEEYFSDNWEVIKDFIRHKKFEMEYLLEDGRLTKVENHIRHNTAPTDVAVRLYGINKWSSENGVDILVHIHFNDHPRARTDLPGKYRGFAIYVPEKQYSNSEAAQEIAKNVFDKLSESFAPSDFPKEAKGIVESSNLIAIGSANTVDGASILVEYGYIYRSQFTNPATRGGTLEKMAELTYLGIEDFFE